MQKRDESLHPFSNKTKPYFYEKKTILVCLNAYLKNTLN